MQFAESNGYITDEQYGGRKHRMAQSAVLNKIAYYNISHQTLTGCAFMDDDARACYDRILSSLSSAGCRRWGLSHDITKFTNTFLENQQYHVRSAYGISEASYTYSKDDPIQGSGQGVSWAGPRWTCTSNTICEVMKTTNTGMKFVDPTGEIEINKTSDLFVDDTAKGVSSNNIQDGRSSLEHLQDDEQKHAFYCILQDICLHYINVFSTFIFLSSKVQNSYILLLQNLQVNYTFNRNMVATLKVLNDWNLIRLIKR